MPYKTLLEKGRPLGTGVAPHPRVPSSARPAGAELELPRPGAKMSPPAGIHTNGMGTSPKSLRVHPCSFSHDSEIHQGIEYSPPCP